MAINIMSRCDHAEHLHTGRVSKQLFHQSAENARGVLARSIQSGLPVRQVARYSASAICGSFPSYKMGKAMAVESRVELDALSLTDVLEIVESYAVQSVQIRFPHEGKICTAIPDIAIRTITGGLEIWECKPDTGPNQAALDRLQSLHESLRECGIAYRIIRPEWIRQEPRSANAKRIWQQIDCAVPPHVRETVVSLLQMGVDTLGDLQQKIGCPTTWLLALVGQGKLAADIHTAQLGPDTRVRAPLLGATSGGC